MNKSKIEWTDKTWNPVTGCTPISEGCQNCYAERMSNRLRGRFGYSGDRPFQVTYHHDRLHQPQSWKKPQRIFVCSMGDLFHDDVSGTHIRWILGVIQDNPHHTFQILTKRPERMKSFINEFQKYKTVENLWVGVTAENQEQADKRIPVLLEIPALVRFVSVEPMLEMIDISKYLKCESCIDPSVCWCSDPKIDWVICGAETGHKKRYMDISWAHNLKTQCDNISIDKNKKTPFFFKKDSFGEFPEILGRKFPKKEE
jgi:protein gp37